MEGKILLYGMTDCSAYAECDVLNAHHVRKEPRLMERMGSPQCGRRGGPTKGVNLVIAAILSCQSKAYLATRALDP